MGREEYTIGKPIITKRAEGLQQLKWDSNFCCFFSLSSRDQAISDRRNTPNPKMICDFSYVLLAVFMDVVATGRLCCPYPYASHDSKACSGRIRRCLGIWRAASGLQLSSLRFFHLTWNMAGWCREYMGSETCSGCNILHNVLNHLTILWLPKYGESFDILDPIPTYSNMQHRETEVLAMQRNPSSAKLFAWGCRRIKSMGFNGHLQVIWEEA